MNQHAAVTQRHHIAARTKIERGGQHSTRGDGNIAVNMDAEVLNSNRCNAVAGGDNHRISTQDTQRSRAGDHARGGVERQALRQSTRSDGETRRGETAGSHREGIGNAFQEDGGCGTGKGRRLIHGQGEVLTGIGQDAIGGPHHHSVDATCERGRCAGKHPGGGGQGHPRRQRTRDTVSAGRIPGSCQAEGTHCARHHGSSIGAGEHGRLIHHQGDRSLRLQIVAGCGGIDCQGIGTVGQYRAGARGVGQYPRGCRACRAGTRHGGIELGGTERCPLENVGRIGPGDGLGRLVHQQGHRIYRYQIVAGGCGRDRQCLATGIEKRAGRRSVGQCTGGTTTTHTTGHRVELGATEQRSVGDSRRGYPGN